MTAPPSSAQTLPDMLADWAQRAPDKTALRKKSLGRWREYTWADYRDRVATSAASLSSLDIGAGGAVAILSGNRPGWLFVDLAVQSIGARSVGVYPTSSASEVGYVLGHSEASIVFVEDEEQLDKVLEVRDQLPLLSLIVVFDTRQIRGLDRHDKVMSFQDFEALAPTVNEERLSSWDAQRAQLDPAQTTLLVYTSGTTGHPKGAMLSQRNLVEAAETFVKAWGVHADDELMSYLPLCHVAERLMSVANGVHAGYIVNFGEGPETFANDLAELAPTVFLGVPRVWEKFMAGVELRMQDASAVRRKAYRWALAAGAKAAVKRRRTGGSSLTLLPATLLIGRPLMKKLGLARARVALTGAAPISTEVLEYFWAFGVDIREVYGQTEGTALATANVGWPVKLGTVGRALNGVELRLLEDGEITVRGPGVFNGYFKDEAATAATVDEDGWLHTGDVGTLDDDGFLTITDRKKDLIITSGGKNISPSFIENKLKVSPHISEAIVIGDARKYCTALIGVDAEAVADWAGRQNLAFGSYSELAQLPEVRSLVDGWVQSVNEGLAPVEQIKRFHLLEKELDIDDGELTATQKVKRSAIQSLYGSQIEGMYR
ncbi:MAG: AMP-binding protein [Actinobacteria bacterium]|nr:AMP-binding protein [Actinomycetota bacterium]